jgi:hypothetical protein
MPEKQKGQEWAGNKMLPKAGQVVDHRAHLLSKWTAPKVKLPHKIEKQGTIITHWQQGRWGEADGTLALPQRKDEGQRNKPPAYKSQ